MTRAGNTTRPRRPKTAGTTARPAPADMADRMAPTGTGHSTNRVAPVNAEEGRPVTPAPENGDAR
ncbi:hypothetical protein GCM10014715_73820 [Streptomyces spiralis]|uniref:Uncharacterized protein n=1 Tax=Streptomyces spiralis TaxID=66376 RepID=A0A919E374_9ACTN|nr:hypothetical protein GCM10014715_73820 [Streptomyces spiralis]